MPFPLFDAPLREPSQFVGFPGNVIDSRSEHMLVYKTVNQNSLELFQSYNLPRMFADARNRAAGRIK